MRKVNQSVYIQSECAQGMVVQSLIQHAYVALKENGVIERKLN